jgi:glycine betaine/proline transport system ATP-binding protein
MLQASPKIVLEHVNKLFGSNQEEALRLLDDGRSKEEILDATGCTIAVHDVNLTINAGEIFVIMGLSGSGKSTLVRMINGLITPTSGNVVVDGRDVASADKRELRHIRRDIVSMVFQHFALFPHKTIAANTAFGLRVRGVAAKERRQKAIDALEQVGLAAYADARPDELSGGMQQRVGLARCLASDPEILLMDEPFSALDPLIRRDMQGDLLELQRRLKKTIVFISHDLNEALTLGDRIAIMKDGAIVQVGTGEEIVDNPVNDYVAAFTQDVDRSRVFTAASVRSDAEAVQLETDDPEVAMTRMEELNRDAIYVLDGTKIAGVVTYRDLSKLDDRHGKLQPALITDFPLASPHTQLHELYPLAQQCLPIALTDRRDHLIGTVETQDLFARLATTDQEAGDTESGTEVAAPERVQ